MEVREPLIELSRNYNPTDEDISLIYVKQDRLSKFLKVIPLHETVIAKIFVSKIQTLFIMLGIAKYLDLLYGNIIELIISTALCLR